MHARVHVTHVLYRSPHQLCTWHLLAYICMAAEVLRRGVCSRSNGLPVQVQSIHVLAITLLPLPSPLAHAGVAVVSALFDAADVTAAAHGLRQALGR